MNPRSLFVFLLTLTVTSADNVELFWNLYDAVVSGGRILHDVANGVGAVSKAIQAIDTFLDASAAQQVAELLPPKEESNSNQAVTIEETAPATASSADAATPAADEVPIPSSFNGCGALGLHIRDDTLPISTMTDCCGVHDTCYAASCRANKKECDGKLRTCLFSACDGRPADKMLQKSCRGAAKLLFSGTMALSFQQYNGAQEKLGCIRPPPPQKFLKGGKKGIWKQKSPTTKGNSSGQGMGTEEDRRK